ncbi:hypothetical protein [Cupriavidus sp. RAF12]|uniref:hypothetical protein n=1 Tax=Cupriavidus sp. RAF12 TaxID=3233050 RepID=UPI003F8E397C
MPRKSAYLSLTHFDLAKAPPIHSASVVSPWWYALVTLGLTHVTTASVTIFVRCHQPDGHKHP